eukprot:gene7626-7110_t
MSGCDDGRELLPTTLSPGNTDPEDPDNCKGGVLPGSQYTREKLAYQLDHGHRAGVPETVVVSLPSWLFPTSCAGEVKQGSLQAFVYDVGGRPAK